MRLIVTESKKEKMSEYAEKMLHYGGKLMQCIENLGDDDMGERDEDYMGERNHYSRYGQDYGNRYGNRWADDDDNMGMRMRRRSNGRYY